MAKVAVFIHGMWGTPDVRRSRRPFLEAFGRQTIAPALRHHDAPPLAPPAELGTIRLGDYIADLTNAIEGLPEKQVMIGHSLSHTFNTSDPWEGAELDSAFVHDSGGALFEIALPWLDGSKTTTVDPRRLVTAPLLFVSANRDKLTPTGVVRRSSKRFDHVADDVDCPSHGHWLPAQPGWERIAEDTLTWLDGKAA